MSAKGTKAADRSPPYPGGPLPEDGVGGAVEGIGVTGGVARLVLADTGQPAGRVQPAELTRHTDGRFYYFFKGVADGSYRVSIELNDGRRLSSGLAMPGVETGDVFAD
jgi:hypothetical protein